MAEVQRRATSVSDLGGEKRERRKSGIFFFNRSFKKSSTFSSEGDSSPTSPTLAPVKDGFELERTDSGRTIAAPATSPITAEAERTLGSSPMSASHSLGEATQTKSPEEIKASGATEDLPTPPDTPGPSNENADEPGEHGEAEEAPVPEVKKISYHADADLDITVRESNGDGAVYSVRSSVLKSASRVWKQSIPSLVSENVDLVSDPAFGLSVIFSIAHYKFQDLPQKLNVSELYDVAVAVEKYQTKHLLVPFVRGWLATVALPDTTTGSQNEVDKVLVAGWVLGQAQWFSQTVSQCAYNASMSADGTLLDSEGKPWASQPVSSEVLELIAAVRLDAIDQIIKAVSGPVNKLLNPQFYPGEDIRYCHAHAAGESVREECEQLQLGSAIMGLTKAKLWPPPEASRVKASPVELARAYAGVRMRRYQTPGLRFLEGEGVEDVHAQCGFGHQGEVEKILSRPAQLTTVVVKELQVRAKTSGVYSEDVFEDLKEYLVEEAIPSAEEVLDADQVASEQAVPETTTEVV